MQENEAQEEILNFNEPTYTFKPNEVHEWRQQGPFLVCKNCELVHSVFIGMQKIMVGVDEKGRPKLNKRFVSK